MTDQPTIHNTEIDAETAEKNTASVTAPDADPVAESDDILYRRFLDGDNTGYELLTRRYGDSVTRYLYRYVHDMQEAEDLMIDAFVQILVKKPNIGAGAFKAYLYRTARNLALRFHERRQRLQTFSIEGVEEEIPDRDTVESRLGEQDRRRILNACLNRLEPDIREALCLVYIENLSYAQVAEVLGVKPRRVDRLLARGKQALRRELEKEGVTNSYDR